MFGTTPNVGGPMAGGMGGMGGIGGKQPILAKQNTQKGGGVPNGL